MIRTFAAALLSFSLALGSAVAGTEGAEGFVKTLVADLRAEAEAHGEGSPEVRARLQDNLAAEDIGRFLLAGDAAKSATDEERQRYDTLFPSYIAAAYADEIGQLTAREIEVKESLERRPGDYIVQSVLRDKEGRARADIDWRVRETEAGEYKLLDVLVERTSPLITRRQSFSKRVSDTGVAGLLVHMEEIIAAGASGS